MKCLCCGLIVVYWLLIWEKMLNFNSYHIICRFFGDRQLFSTAGNWSGSTFKMSVVIILSCISNKITCIYITELWGHSWQYFNFSSIPSCWHNKCYPKYIWKRKHLAVDAFMRYEAMLMFVKYMFELIHENRHK